MQAVSKGIHTVVDVHAGVDIICGALHALLADEEVVLVDITLYACLAAVEVQ
jgi:hypothetical protein